MNHPESTHQIALIKWASMVRHPDLDGVIGDYLFAIPNGGRRGKLEASILKAEGVKPGIPDLFLAVPTADCAGLFIEMKIKPNRVSKEQVAVMKRFVLQGYAAEVAWSWDEAKDMILNYLK